MGERDNPISVRSKRRITDSLLDLMKDHPFNKISIKDIVEKAGLTRQTFYHNFESKEEVLKHKEGELFEDFLRYLVEKQVTEWHNIVLYYFRYWQRHADFVRLLIKDDLVYIMENKAPDYCGTIRNNISLEDSGLTELEFNYIYSFCSGAIINLLVSWIKSGMALPAQDMTDLVMKLLDGTILEQDANLVRFPPVPEE